MCDGGCEREGERKGVGEMENEGIVYASVCVWEGVERV